MDRLDRSRFSWLVGAHRASPCRLNQPAHQFAGRVWPTAIEASVARQIRSTLMSRRFPPRPSVSPVVQAFDFLVAPQTSNRIEALCNDRYFQRTTLALRGSPRDSQQGSLDRRRRTPALRSHFPTSAMITPKGSRLTSIAFADDCGVATKAFRLAEANPLSARLKFAFCGEADMFSATSTAFPL